jgi:hypothetical protein
MASKTSEAPEAVFSPPVEVRPSTALCAHALFNPSPDFGGCLALYLVEKRNVDGHTQEFVSVVHSGARRKDGWMEAKHTLTTATNTVSIVYRVEGSFTGSVVLADLSLCCQEPASPPGQ